MFSFLRKQKADLFFLQETHLCGSSALARWKLEWGGGHIISSDGETNARGTAVLVHPKSKVTIVEERLSVNGRYVAEVIQVEGKQYTIGNVYAPNEDDVGFFTQFISDLEKLTATEGMFLGGDFNLS